jgi:thiol-disulfide isomerase/thioredoxin
VNTFHDQPAYKKIQSITKIFQLIFVLLFTSFIFLSSAHAKNSTKISSKVQLDTLIKHHQGDVIYLDFWASWCGPCRKSFPWMNKIQSEHQSEGFTVISINVDSEQTLATEFLTNNPAKFTVVYDPKGELARFFKIQGMPSSLIIDKKGNIKYAHSGFYTERTSQYEQEIKQLLAL